MRKIITFLSAIIIPLFFHVRAYAADTVIDLNKPPQVANTTGVNVNTTVNWVINTLSVIGVVAALIFLLYGGIKWITSGGDKGAVDAARSHIIAALIGLIIVVLSFVILNIVFGLLGITGGLPGQLTIPSL